MKLAAPGRGAPLPPRISRPTCYRALKPKRPAKRHLFCSSLRQSQQAAPSMQNKSTLESEGVTQDITQLFAKAQRNLMEVNRSRLNALQELGAAHARIAELEQQLRDATGASSDLTSDSGHASSHPSSSSTSRDSSTAPSSTSQAPNDTKSPNRPTAGITLAYQTGWHRAFLHCNADHKGWTQAPGKEMLPGTGDMSHSRVITIDAHHLEFVINNGSNDWDSPDPYGLTAQKNYVIDGHGAYRLKSGKVHKL